MLPGAMASELALFSLVVNQPGVLFDDNTMQDISAAAQTYQRKSQESVDGKFSRASQNSPSKSGLSNGTSQSPVGAPTEASLKTSSEYSPDSKAKLTAVAPEFVPPGASIAQASVPSLLPTNVHAVNHHLAAAPDRWANDATVGSCLIDSCHKALCALQLITYISFRKPGSGARSERCNRT